MIKDLKKLQSKMLNAGLKKEALYLKRLIKEAERPESFQYEREFDRLLYHEDVLSSYSSNAYIEVPGARGCLEKAAERLNRLADKIQDELVAGAIRRSTGQRDEVTLPYQGSEKTIDMSQQAIKMEHVPVKLSEFDLKAARESVKNFLRSDKMAQYGIIINDNQVEDPKIISTGWRSHQGGGFSDDYIGSSGEDGNMLSHREAELLITRAKGMLTAIRSDTHRGGGSLFETWGDPDASAKPNETESMLAQVTQHYLSCLREALETDRKQAEREEIIDSNIKRIEKDRREYESSDRYEGAGIDDL